MKLEGFSRYEIDVENGKVYSEISKKYLKTDITRDGYHLVTLYDDNKKFHRFSLHRLVYLVAYGRIPEDMEVNHIDEDKSNNGINNLNLLTPTENKRWGTAIQRSSEKQKGKKCPYMKAFNVETKSKPVQGISLDDGHCIFFPSMSEAARNGFQQASIQRCCAGKQIKHKNYIWKYLENNDKESS